MSAAGLACSNLTITVPGRVLVAGLELEIRSGSFLGILGRNGAGKTTTLHTLCGLRPQQNSRVILDGKPIGAWPRKQIARRIGFVTQHLEDPFPTSVLETVVAGRHPHLDFWRWESAADRRLAREALARMELEGLEDRAVDTLSGGERRRLEIAMLLCQDTPTCLLDEPTNHLDPAHEKAVLSLLRKLADQGRGVAASLHDVNAASRFCDRCLLLFGDGEWTVGATESVLSEETLFRLYGVNMRHFRHMGQRLFVTT